MKHCPKCDTDKPVEEFGKLFCKTRQVFKYQSYCKSCKVKYIKERKIIYNKTEAHKNTGRNKKTRHRKELQDCYVASIIGQKWGKKTSDIKSVPGLIETYRLNIILKRLIHEKSK